MPQDKKYEERSNQDIAEGIAAFELGEDCCCDSESKCKFHRLSEHIKEFLDAKDTLADEKDKRIEEIRNLVLDDVPHQYQKRLLEILK